jgi:hypothetical protein
MQILFEVAVEVEKEQGKFVSKDEIIDQIASELESVDPGTLYVEESTYAVVSWEVFPK